MMSYVLAVTCDQTGALLSQRFFSCSYYIALMPSGKSQSNRRYKKRRSSKVIRNNSRRIRRRAHQHGSGVFDSIFSSKWLNWLDKKKDPEEENKKTSDLANDKQNIMDKLDAELASIKAKYPETQDVKPSTLPLVVESSTLGQQVGRGRRGRRKSHSRSGHRKR